MIGAVGSIVAVEEIAVTVAASGRVAVAPTTTVTVTMTSIGEVDHQEISTTEIGAAIVVIMVILMKMVVVAVAETGATEDEEILAAVVVIAGPVKKERVSPRIFLIQHPVLVLFHFYGNFMTYSWFFHASRYVW